MTHTHTPPTEKEGRRIRAADNRFDQLNSLTNSPAHKRGQDLQSNKFAVAASAMPVQCYYLRAGRAIFLFQAHGENEGIERRSDAVSLAAGRAAEGKPDTCELENGKEGREKIPYLWTGQGKGGTGDVIYPRREWTKRGPARKGRLALDSQSLNAHEFFSCKERKLRFSSSPPLSL